MFFSPFFEQVTVVESSWWFVPKIMCHDRTRRARFKKVRMGKFSIVLSFENSVDETVLSCIFCGSGAPGSRTSNTCKNTPTLAVFVPGIGSCTFSD